MWATESQGHTIVHTSRLVHHNTVTIHWTIIRYWLSALTAAPVHDHVCPRWMLCIAAVSQPSLHHACRQWQPVLNIAHPRNSCAGFQADASNDLCASGVQATATNSSSAVALQ